MKWKEVSVLTHGVCVEAITGLFHQLGSGGVIIEDPQAARTYVNKIKWNEGTDSLDVLEHEFIVVKAYFPEDRKIIEDLKLNIEKVEKTFNYRCKMYIGEVNQKDWEDAWKKYYHTFKIGDRLIIKPSWEDYEPKESEVIIELDPGMAFGTGIHASTRFCLKFIDKYMQGEETVIDAGCGSGILSIAAAKIGANKIFAVDIDDVAVKVAKENIHLNKLDHIVNVAEGDIIEAINEQKDTDIILANITAEVVSLLIPQAYRSLKPGGYIFGSGIVEGRWPGVKKQLEENNFIIEEVLQDVDWIGVVAKKA
ncbi:Ribosomal protein L11 methyltransferase [Candidatus Syntrophocurvum alkaliphilum]|uniref:Ribosomal protein L11 methyltransferase n=1 Tax=Candidatus Syntrophocurvum alkaliphilum TaxID=2293317 RepID=A0A6I6DBH3_9FIRM|nr:50S ribosomal protein L11 methyltransferase [Candidatus Syntrophocurvum alkaliphilum]QGT99995.1 Ribosomal protein L11 methyltransferase [Candidatus Syntrophocurvum alkaliphilum]